MNIFEKRKIIFESSSEYHRKKEEEHSLTTGDKEGDQLFYGVHPKLHSVRGKMSKLHRIAAKSSEAAEKHKSKHGEDDRYKQLKKRSETLTNHADHKEVNYQLKTNKLDKQDQTKPHRDGAGHHKEMAMAHKVAGDDKGHKLHSKAASAHKEAGEYRESIRGGMTNYESQAFREKRVKAIKASNAASKHSEKNPVDKNKIGWD